MSWGRRKWRLLVVALATTLVFVLGGGTAVAYYKEDVLVEPDLVSYWRLNDSGSTAVDSKGTNPGTFYGTVTKGVTGLVTADAGNVAGDFDGSTGRVSVPDSSSLDLSGPLTLEAWIRPDALTGGDGYYTILR